MPDREELERLNGPESVTPETAAIRGQQGQRLREAIRRLPPHYRIVIVLRDMEGFSDEEVGEIIGLQPGTVRVRLHRARLFVRHEMSKLSESPKRKISAGSQINARTPSPTRRCRHIFSRLSDYLDGQLDDFSCEEIEAHLNGCEPCKKFLHSLEATIELCHQSPSECPAQEKAVALRKELLAVYSRALAMGAK